MVGRPGARRRALGPHDLPTRRHPRLAVDRAARARDHAAHLGTRVARPLPRPLAGRAAPARRQADARRRPRLRLRLRDLPTPPGAGTPGRLDPHLPRGPPARRPDRLLGSPTAPHPGPPPTAPRPRRFPNVLPAARPHSPKRRRRRSSPHRLLGPTTPSLAHPARLEHTSPDAGSVRRRLS